MRKTATSRTTPEWTQLLIEAARTPGILSSAYRQFWNYSVGNQLLAMFECLRRGIPSGPINTFTRWLELGRHVKKGEKAITLCMPVTVKRKRRSKEQETSNHADRPTKPSAKESGDSDESDRETMTVFTLKPRWFVLSQTEGADYVPTELPGWSESNALQFLKIERIEFTHPDGNCQGFARCRHVAVSPIAKLPHKTLFHELAHVVLGHTTEADLDDHDRTPKCLREVEAECVALICCESLALVGSAECRGYIQHWLVGESIPNRSAQRIFKGADAILKAGYPASPASSPQSAANRD